MLGMFRGLVGQLAMALTVVVSLGCWGLLLVAGVPVLRTFGVSTQVAAGALSVLFFIAFWIVARNVLFGVQGGGKSRVEAAQRTGLHHSDRQAGAPSGGETTAWDQQDTTHLRHNWWHIIAVVGVGSLISPLVSLLILYFDPAVILGLPLLLGAVPGVLLFISIGVPPAFYFDAKYVRAVAPDWHPDSRLYGLLGVAVMGLLVFKFLSIAVVAAAPPCLWYLYKRHIHVGVP
jgi:hypothetical protein